MYDINSAPATAKELTGDEKDTKTILNEYIHFQDIKVTIYLNRKLKIKLA